MTAPQEQHLYKVTYRYGTTAKGRTVVIKLDKLESLLR